MSFKYGFYNSMNGDRKYGANDFAHIFDGIIQDGVFATIGRSMIVTAGSGMSVIVGSGKAWFDHTWSWLTADMPLDISAASGAYSRYDAVVLETDDGTRVNEIKVITGTPSSSPVKPSLTPRQHCLAYVNVPAAATSITAANIEVVVGTSATPFVTGILQLLNLDAVIMQKTPVWESEFREWFAHLRNELSSNQAANLQRQIDEFDTFHVGDLLTTKATDLDDSWALANGDVYSTSSYPDAGVIFGAEPVVAAPSTPKSTDVNDTPIWSRRVGDYAIYGHTYLHRNRIAVCRIPESGETVTKVGGFSMDEGWSSYYDFVAYDETRNKYVAVVPGRTYYSRPNPQFHEADDITLSPSSPIDRIDWPRVGELPNSVFGENLVSPPVVYDFIWWGGYYFIALPCLNASDVAVACIWRAQELSGPWAKVMEADYVPDDYAHSADGRFHIVDGLGLAYLSHRTDRRPGKSGDYVIELAYAPTPLSNFFKMEGDVPAAQWSNSAKKDEIVKIGSDYYIQGCLSKTQWDGVLGVTFRHLMKVTFNGTTSLTLTPVEPFLPKSAGSAQATSPWRVYQIGSYYIAIADYGYNSSYSGPVAIYRQSIADYPEINLTNPTAWERVYVFDNRAEGDIYPLVYGTTLDLGNDRFMMMSEYSHSGGTGQTFDFKVYTMDAFAVPSVPSAVSGFSNYVKIKKGRWN